MRDVEREAAGLPGDLGAGISKSPIERRQAGRAYDGAARAAPRGSGASPVYCTGYSGRGIASSKGGTTAAMPPTPGVVITTKQGFPYWPNQDPVGKRRKIGGMDSQNP